AARRRLHRADAPGSRPHDLGRDGATWVRPLRSRAGSDVPAGAVGGADPGGANRPHDHAVPAEPGVLTMPDNHISRRTFLTLTAAGAAGAALGAAASAPTSRAATATGGGGGGSPGAPPPPRVRAASPRRPSRAPKPTPTA